MGARQSTVNRFPGSYPEDSGDTDFSSSEMTLRRVTRRPSVPSDSEFAHSTDISSSSMSKRRAFSESDTLALGERDRSRLNQNRKRKPGCEEILCWKENFSSLLSHPIGYELFLLFLKEEHSEESILFWRACEEFKRSSFRVSAKARRLYRTYVKVDSQHEVNLDYRERRKIEEALKSPKKSIFDEAQRKPSLGRFVFRSIVDCDVTEPRFMLRSNAFSKAWLAKLIYLRFGNGCPKCPRALCAKPEIRVMPKIQFRSNAKPSLYAYPEPLQPPKKEEKEKVSTAILSITAKAKARAKKSKDDEAMDVDEKDKGTEKGKKESSEDSNQESKEKISAEKTEEKAEKDKSETDNEGKGKTSEPDFQMLENPARVMTAQRKVVTLPTDCRYSPIKPVSVGGIVLLKDSKSEEPENLIEPLPASMTTDSEDEKEPDPPEPFTYTED
eukprot:gene16346-7738_t